MVKTVVITGLNGFVAAHVAVRFLAAGWHVRGTVRTEAGAATLRAHRTYKPHVDAGAVEVVVLADIVKGDFGPVLAGAHAVVHLAAPIPGSTKPDLDEFVKPTVGSMDNLVRAAAKVPSIEALSIISSAVAVYTPGVPGTYTEKDYFTMSEEEVRKYDPNDVMYYSLAKTLGEKKAVAVHQESGAKFQLSLVCPPMVYGPILNLDSIDKPSSGISETLQLGLIKGKDAPLPPDYANIYADGRDLAEVFFRLVDRKVDGRFIVCNPDLTSWAQVTDDLRRLRPRLAEYFPQSKTDGGSLSDDFNALKLDSSKSVEVLGIKYHTREETFTDLIDDLVAIGAVTPQSA